VYERIELEDDVNSFRTDKQATKYLYYNRKVDYVYVDVGPYDSTAVTKHWYVLRTIASRVSIPRIVLSRYPQNSPSVAIIEKFPEIFPVRTYRDLVITSSAMRHWNRFTFWISIKGLTEARGMILALNTCHFRIRRLV